jgi:hypothetical protein
MRCIAMAVASCRRKSSATAMPVQQHVQAVRGLPAATAIAAVPRLAQMAGKRPSAEPAAAC